MNDNDLIIYDDHGNALSADDPQQVDVPPAMVYVKSLKERSRRTMIHSLNLVAEILGLDPDDYTIVGTNQATGRAIRRNMAYLKAPWHEMTVNDADFVRATLLEMIEAEEITPAGANKALVAMRQVLKYTWRQGLIDGELYHKLRDVEQFAAESSEVAGRDLELTEIAALFDACAADENRAKGARDAALIALAYATGGRRQSIADLQIEDVDFKQRYVTFRRAKRGKTYETPINAGAIEALIDWLKVAGNPKTGPLFRRVSKRGSVILKPISAQSVYNILKLRAKQAGIEDFSPHDLRRTLAGDLLDAGVDIVAVRDILGHASVDTTARYDRRPMRQRRDAVDQLIVPYKGHRNDL